MNASWVLPGFVARPSSANSVSIKIHHTGTSILTEVRNELPLRDDVLRLQGPVDREAMATGALPPDLSNPASSNLEDATSCLLIGIAAEVANQRSHVLLLCNYDQIRKHHKTVVNSGP